MVFLFLIFVNLVVRLFHVIEDGLGEIALVTSTFLIILNVVSIFLQVLQMMRLGLVLLLMVLVAI